MRRSFRLPALVGLCALMLVGGARAITLTPAVDFQTLGNSSGATGGSSGGFTLNFRFQSSPRVDNRFGMEFSLAAVPVSHVIASATWRGTAATVSGTGSLWQLYAYSGNGTFQNSDTYQETSLVGQIAGAAANVEQSIEFDPGYITTLHGTATHVGINGRERTNNIQGTLNSRITGSPPKLDLTLIDPLAVTSNRYVGAGAQSWNVAGNWSDGIPVTADDIFLRPTSTSTIQGPAGPQQVNSFTLGGIGSSPVAFVVDAGVDFESHGLTTLGTGGTLRIGDGIFRTGGLNTATGGTIDWAGGGTLVVDAGYLSSPVGDFVVDGPNMPALAMSGGKMRKSTSTDTAIDRLIIGDDENGMMIVSAQSDVEARNVRVGLQSTGYGRIHVGETGSIFKPVGAMEIGPLGRGEVTVSMGGRMEAGLIVVGATLQGAIDNDDVDRLTITDPGTIAKVSSIEADGRSIVEIKNGAVVDAVSIGGAGDAAQPPVFRVTGLGTRLNLTDRVQFGSTLATNASSQFFVEDGARVDTGRLILGIGSSTTGISRSAMTVSGAGSQVNTTNVVLLGGLRDSESSLDVLDGAVLRAGNTTAIGYTTSATPANTIGNVRISGAGARWEQTGEIGVGGVRDLSGNLADLGTASLTIENGGTLTATTALHVMLRGTLNFSGGKIELPLVTNNRGGAFNFTGGTLAVGQFDGDLVQQGGTLAAGNSPGTMNIGGDYTLENDGILEVELATDSSPGTGYDQYVVIGDASLAGKLKVVLLNGFQPTLGDSFQFLTAQGSLTSSLDLSLLPQLPGDLGWELAATAHAISLNVVTGFLDGDFNHDHVVDAADYTVWRNGLGTNYFPSDFGLWKSHFGERRAPGSGSMQPTASVPEPASIALVLAFAAMVSSSSGRRRPR